MALFITAFQGNISLTLQNLLFHVANDPEVQEKLHRECVEALASGDAIKCQMPYLGVRVCARSSRLQPQTKP